MVFDEEMAAVREITSRTRRFRKLGLHLSTISEQFKWRASPLGKPLQDTESPHLAVQRASLSPSLHLSLSLSIPHLCDGRCQHLLQSLDVHSHGTNVLHFGPGGRFPRSSPPRCSLFVSKQSYRSASCHLIRANLVG